MRLEIIEQSNGYFTLLNKETGQETFNLSFTEMIDCVARKREPIGTYSTSGRPCFKGDEVRV